MTEIVYARSNGWLPRAVRIDGALRLEIVGGADALHDPREFSIPLSAGHVEALRADLARHLILYSALLPLCYAAGSRGDLDEATAVALLDPLLSGPADAVDALLAHTRWSRDTLIAHGADPALLDAGRIVEATAAAAEASVWSRVDEDRARRSRVERGVVLSELDTAVLTYTGQLLHRATVPSRRPEQVDASMLADVLGVIRTAETATAGLRIARDPRRSTRDTVKADRQAMSAAAEAALRAHRPVLSADTIRSVAFLVCTEAADAARSGPFDADGIALPATLPAQPLRFTDDDDLERTWAPGNPIPAAEAFWAFVAERAEAGVSGASLELLESGTGIHIQHGLDLLARYRTPGPDQDTAEDATDIEFALVDGMADYRGLIRAAISGGYEALDGLADWLPDAASFQDAWRRRDAERKRGGPPHPTSDKESPR